MSEVRIEVRTSAGRTEQLASERVRGEHALTVEGAGVGTGALTA